MPLAQVKYAQKATKNGAIHVGKLDACLQLNPSET
jgi:hypothetical protein